MVCKKVAITYVMLHTFHLIGTLQRQLWHNTYIYTHHRKISATIITQNNQVISHIHHIYFTINTFCR